MFRTSVPFKVAHPLGIILSHESGKHAQTDAGGSDVCDCPCFWDTSAQFVELLFVEPAAVAVISSLTFLEVWMLRAVCRHMQICQGAKPVLSQKKSVPIVPRVSSDCHTLEGTLQIMEDVQMNPAHLEQPDCAGRTLLMRAAHQGIPRLCRALLAAKARINARGGNGWTALHYAATGKSAETCKMLLDHAADLEAHSYDGCTPFYYAYRAGEQAEIMSVLHSRGARPDLRSRNAAGTADWGYLKYAGR